LLPLGCIVGPAIVFGECLVTDREIYSTNRTTITNAEQRHLCQSAERLVCRHTGDFNGDGKSDILSIDSGGNVSVYFMNGATVASAASYRDGGTTWKDPVAQR
jgi:Ni2+-binding GTPase involved in maturation of urease and hydrogenase